jgi:hypothetical protein
MVAPPGSPADGFVITIQWDNGVYHPEMHNTREINGRQDLAAIPAFNEVSAFSVSDIEALFAEAKLASAPNAKLCRNALGKPIKCRP